MSQENVEVVRRAMEAIQGRDRTTYLALHDDDFEVVNVPDFPERAVRGAEAAWDFYIEAFEAFERVPIEDAELVDAGADKVLVHQRYDVRGAASGAPVEMDFWNVIKFRKGRISRMEWFTDHAEALEAAGLRE